MQPRWAERQARRLEDGFLPARSPLRRLARPTTTAFAGGRAILMELAHPAIAQEVADVGRDLARAVFWPPVPSNRAPIISLYRIAVFGTLPAGLRWQFGYAWGRPQRRLFVGGSHLARLGAPVTDQLFFAVADGKG